MKASIVVAQLPVSWDVEENLAAITDVDWRAQAVSTGCPRTSAEAISPSEADVDAEASAPSI